MSRIDSKPTWWCVNMDISIKMKTFYHVLVLTWIVLFGGSPLFGQVLDKHQANVTKSDKSSVAATDAPQTDMDDLSSQDHSDLRLSVGSSIEYQGDGYNTEYTLPFFLEYGLTERLTLLVEPRYKFVKTKNNVFTNGIGDLTTAATYEFLHEGLNYPAMAIEGDIKWPTAEQGLGTGKTDYSLGIIARKSFGHLDLDARGVYTFIGNTDGLNLQNTIKGTLSLEWHVSPWIDVMGEIAGGIGNGNDTNIEIQSNMTEGSGELEAETTMGLAEHISQRFQLVQEVTYMFDGTKRAMFGLQWDFGTASTLLHRWSDDPID